MEILAKCPICEHTKLNEFLSCKDHSISKEEFFINQCNQCGFLFTNPRPTASEIGKYYNSDVYISHHADKKGFIPWVYRLIRNIQFINKTFLIKQNSVKNPTVLDIGCGTGEFIKYCTALGWKSVGVEPDEDARRIANTNETPVYDTAFLGETNTKYDVITMWHVLEHVHNLNERLNQLSTLLNDNGIVIIAVPNPESYDAKRYKTFWAAYDLPRHLWHFSQKTITQLFQKEHFKLVKIEPMKYDSYYVSMKSEEYKNPNKIMNLIKGIWYGLISNLKATTGKQYSSLIYVFKK